MTLRKLAEAARPYDVITPTGFVTRKDARAEHDFIAAASPDVILRLLAIEDAARAREHAEKVWADANEVYNTSTNPTFTRQFLQIDRLETERAEAVLKLREALDPAADRIAP